MSDLISRQDAIDAVMKYGKQIPTFAIAVKDALENLPSEQPERKKGEWIEQDDGCDGVFYECSVCKDAFTLMDGTPSDNNYNFCPNCGADMRGEQDD